MGFGWAVTSTARNIAYRRSLYDKTDGFSGIGHLRSGDDDLMLLKMDPMIRKRNFMFGNKASIPTHDKENTAEQLDLEKRRASKFRYFPTSLQVMILLVFVYYLLFIPTFLFCILGHINMVVMVFLILLKLVPEYMLLKRMCLKLCRIDLIRYIPLFLLFYIPFFIFIGIAGTFGKYNWK